MACPIRFSDSGGVRNFSRSPVLRHEHIDPGCVARALSGGLTSTSESTPSCDRGSRWLKHERTSLSHHDTANWMASGGLIWNEPKRHTFHTPKQRNSRKSCQRHSIHVKCLSPSEAQTASSEAQTLSDSILSPGTLWEKLKPTINYLSGAQLCMVNDALQLAFEAHDGQRRRSGEPFIIHPVEVATILGELEMDWETIVAGLLHDTVEDTENVTFERIEEQFGPAVRRIVEGETKVSKLGKMQCQHLESKSQDVKADDLRQMFLAMTEEVRVIIVKLADRLHNMRTLGYMPPHKQQYIAQETLQVFAPLAKLLGMFRIKTELEDLSFMYSNRDEYKSLKKRAADLRREQEEVLLEGRKMLLETMDKDQFLGYMTVDVKVRTHYKELYSIYKKMLETKSSVDEVRDIAQLRVIVKLKPGATAGQLCTSQQVCYHVLGLVHGMWPPVPGTVKDYIATPKPNGYQSLHTTVIPFGSKTYFTLEIQIRTEEMDKLAEWGVAAHHSGRVAWNSERDFFGPYSGNGSSVANGSTRRGWSNNLNDAEIARRVSWLNSIREWQEEFVGNMTSREFVDTITGDLLGSRVFVFTPRGEIKNLPKGATVVDYAYHIHTDVGNNMVAAKVNGNLVSPTQTLTNAEVVEIVTYDGASQKKLFDLHRQWLQFAKTRSARHKLTKLEDCVKQLLDIYGDSRSWFFLSSVTLDVVGEQLKVDQSYIVLGSSVTLDVVVEQLKFLKEQGVLSAEELTAESVKDFVGEFSESDLVDSDDDELDGPSDNESLATSTQLEIAEVTWKDTSITAFPTRESDVLKNEKGNPESVPKVSVNGSALNGVPFVAIGKRIGNGSARVSPSPVGLHMSPEDVARVKFDAWQSGRVAMWHGSGGRSLQWLSIFCVDRKRMLAEVTALLGASGVLICACAAETDQSRGLGIMIFHIESDYENLVRACADVEKIGGVLNWATGCSWQNQRTVRICRSA